MSLWSDHSSLIVRWNSHTMNCTCLYYHKMMCRAHSLAPWLLTSILKCKIVFAVWHRHIKFGIRVYHHETTCYLHSWPLYDPDLLLICEWREYPLWVLLTVFILLFSFWCLICSLAMNKNSMSFRILTKLNFVHNWLHHIALIHESKYWLNMIVRIIKVLFFVFWFANAFPPIHQFGIKDTSIPIYG